MKRQVNSEVLMILGMLSVSSYMLFESFSFSYESGIFPRFAATVTIFGCVLLLFQRHLPEPIQQIITNSGGVFDQYIDDFQEPTGGPDTEYDEEYESKTHNANMTKRDETDVDSTKQLLLVGLLAGYGLIGYLIGLVWATPIFISAFAKMFNLPWFKALVIVIIGSVAALAFNSILPVDMTNGVLL